MSRRNKLNDPYTEYWPQWASNFGPAPHGRQRVRPHNAALTNPAPYGGGTRRALLPDVLAHQQWHPQFADSVPIYGSSTGRYTGIWNGPEQQLYQDFNAPAPPAQLNVTFQCMSIEATVQWNHPHAPRNVSYRYEVTVEGGNNVETLELPQWRYMMRLKLSQGTWYKVRVRAISGPRVIAQGSVEFKSVMNRQELWNLYLKAAQYSGDSMHRFEVFYRNKPQRYWDDIRFNRNELMEKYMKDSNGQAASPINDTICGLFFSSNLTKNGRLPTTSPFGDVRLIVRSEKLFVPDTKLYFADFYCTYSVHYVTVVACVPGTESDRFCQRALIPLKTDDNCFMRVYQRVGWLEFWVNDNVWVEFFYTENIPLSIGEFTRVHSTGCSTPGGLPNNKYCQICNLYPLSKRQSEDEEGRNKRASADQQSGRGAKRQRREEEDDFLDDDDEDDFNSTFHLAMELERDRLAEGGREAGNVDVVEAVCALVDNVIPEVGETLEVPKHGNVGLKASQWVEKLRGVKETASRPAEPSGITASSDSGEQKPENNAVKGSEGSAVSQELENTVAATSVKPSFLEGLDKENLGQDGTHALDLLRKANSDLDSKCADLNKCLRSLQESLQTLEKKLRPLR